MLMPLLTVRTASAAVPPTAAAETARPSERAPTVPLRISGSQSEAVLKILETLNRHLIGSEPLPKEALIRLLDTLAKLLKFPPLPQESLRDFSKRLAAFLETLTPAARAALEKQLAQRNLGVSVRLLAEAVKHSAAIDAPRLSDRGFTPARPLPVQTESKSASSVSQGQSVVPGRPASLPVPQALPAGAMIPVDAGRLQSALKKAFGDDDEPAIAKTALEESESGDIRATRRNDSAAVQPGASRTGQETIPLLRAAAAFLAADPQALALVAAIATGEMDEQLKAELEQELELDLSAEPDTSNVPEQAPEAGEPDDQPIRQALRNIEGQKAAPPASQAVSEDLPQPDATAGPVAGGDEPQTEAATSPARTQPSRPAAEIADLQGPDAGSEPDSQFAATADHSQADESPTARAEKTLVQRLKALIESALPLPAGATDSAPEAPFSLFAGETAEMQADMLFAQLDGADEQAAQPRPALYTGGQANPAGFEGEGWTEAEALEEEPAERQVPGRPPVAEDAARDARTVRPETGFIRDAIPFAMIPYLPAAAEEMRKAEADTEDRPDLAGDEERGEEESLLQDDGEEPDGEEEAAGEANESATEDGGDVDAGYGFYRRMGELG